MRSLIPIPTKKNQSSLEKWLIAGLGKKCKMSLGNFAYQLAKKPSKTIRVLSKELRSQLKRFPLFAVWII